MERNPSPIPQKSSSFTSSREDKLRHSDRILSLSSLHFHPISEDAAEVAGENDVENGGKEEREEREDSPANEKQDNNDEITTVAGEIPEHYDLLSLSDDIDQFLAILRNLGDSPESVPEIPDIAILRFTALLEKEIAKYECGGDRWSLDSSENPSFLDSVDRASKLTAALSFFAGADPQYYQAMNQIGAVVHHAMAFLEDEFHSLLIYDPSSKSRKPPAESTSGASKTKRRPSFSLVHEPDRCVLQPNFSDLSPSPDSPSADLSSPRPDHQSATRLRHIAGAMIASGYETECCQVYTIARRNAMDASLSDNGFDRISIDDVLRMPWETLEPEIASWTKAFRQAITISLPRERELCESVFDGPHRPIVDSIIRNLARNLLIQLLAFAEAVSMTKRSAEKLFKVLDMYEALRDMIPKLDEIFDSHTVDEDIKMDLSSVRTRLGEAAVFIFCDLEISIKSDAAKAPVPGGAVHPLTRYVMNYLKYACEYKNTLEQVFNDHRKTDISMPASSSSYDGEEEDDNSARDGGRSAGNSGRSLLFASQVVQVMDLLNANLESKANLYKDLALSSIFMMNNGRYIVQKFKSSAEIKELLGETWCRKKSSDLRKYHKNYQRETWSKILGCFKDEGLQVKGGVSKPVLKERFKIFNSMFEEIHKTQSGWLVSDEQLQSELRVSVSAVVVPAYRSFIGRFSQYLDPGRQTEKYIKFWPEDLESYIDDLFDGNPTSVLKRK
ncbi:exocyst complex component EXO70B1-like [Phalaenopsis equestris]|uniref:exocyst complex component EXO70B1-like n=1 Tax=Phalaenopsis equestris TaxID=78828 RepID=UPI0009E49ADE|nr:exocyst complex component EXO70B1-like [Phalaenopsis equestris]